MPKPKSAKRPASVVEAGVHIYNAYNYLTQLSVLYAEAATVATGTPEAAFWGELSDQLVADLGEVYVAWEAAAAAGRAAGGASLKEVALGRQVACASRRLAALAAGMNVWTPVSRWERIMLLAEKRWQRTLERILSLAPAGEAGLGLLLASSCARANRLGSEVSARAAQEQRISARFDAA